MALSDNYGSKQLRSRFPPLYDTRYTERVKSVLARFLKGPGTELDILSGQPVGGSLIKRARDQMLLDTATGEYLTRLGHNAGIVRPPAAPTDDDLYRQIVQLLSWQPKAILFAFQRLLEIIFGKQQDLIDAGKRPWKIFEVNPCEVIIEVPINLILGSNETDSYLHGIYGVGYSDAMATQPMFFVDGDLTKALPQVPAGLTLFYYDGMTWQSRVINSWQYVGPYTAIITTANIAPGLEGSRFIIDIPGDNVISWRGDYLGPDASEAADTPTTPPHDDYVYLGGNGKLEIFQFYIDLYVRAACIVVRYELI